MSKVKFTKKEGQEKIFPLYKDLKEQQGIKKAAEDKIKELRAPLEELMGDADELLVDDQLMITWKYDKPSEVFDTEQFSKDHPELFKKYKKFKGGARKFILK